MIKYVYLLALLCAANYSFAQSDLADKFIELEYSYENSLQKFYIYSETVELKKKPVFIYLQGSGAKPVIKENETGKISKSYILPEQYLNQSYHFIILPKPGVPFLSKYPESKIDTAFYNNKMSLDYRVDQIDKLINFLINQDYVYMNKIVVFGHSEGAQIAPKLASMNSNITHLALFSGTGSNQMNNFILNVKNAFRRSEITRAEADEQIESLYSTYQDILTNPESTELFFAGHTYKKWSSTFKNSPDKYLSELDIPIYLVCGDEDKVSPIDNIDPMVVSYLNTGKKNLTYKRYWNLDHIYTNVKSGKSEIGSVIKEFLLWLK